MQMDVSQREAPDSIRGMYIKDADKTVIRILKEKNCYWIVLVSSTLIRSAGGPKHRLFTEQYHHTSSELSKSSQSY